MKSWIIISKLTVNLHFNWAADPSTNLHGSIATMSHDSIATRSLKKRFPDNLLACIRQSRIGGTSQQKWAPIIPHRNDVIKYQPAREKAAHHCFRHPHHLYTSKFHSPLRRNLAHKTTSEISSKDCILLAASIRDCLLSIRGILLQPSRLTTIQLGFSTQLCPWVEVSPFYVSQWWQSYMNWNRDDDDSQQCSRVVPIICHLSISMDGCIILSEINFGNVLVHFHWYIRAHVPLGDTCTLKKYEYFQVRD